MTHPHFRQRLEAVGFGVFIPFFFVTSGTQLDVGGLLAGGVAALAPVPIFLLPCYSPAACRPSCTGRESTPGGACCSVTAGDLLAFHRRDAGHRDGARYSETCDGRSPGGRRFAVGRTVPARRPYSPARRKELGIENRESGKGHVMDQFTIPHSQFTIALWGPFARP